MLTRFTQNGRLFVLAVTVAMFAACGGDSSSTGDSNSSNATSNATNAGNNSGADTGADDSNTTPDADDSNATQDTDNDTAPDAENDTTQDADNDTALDAESDTTPDAENDTNNGSPDTAPDLPPCPDTDSDGVCDIDDTCNGFDDTEDADNDGTPDGCDCDAAVCDPNADCNEGREGTRCDCTPGYEGNGFVCTPIDCGSLPAPNNGEVDDNETTFEAVATYTCAPNHELVGNPTRTCQANGSWSGQAPRCVEDIPPCPDADNDGVCNIDDTCNGFDDTEDADNDGTPDGCDCDLTSCADSADCREVRDGTRCTCIPGFSGDGLTCNPVDCGDLAALGNGSIDAESTLFDSTATYTCNDDYTLVGEPTRTCRFDGTWSGQAPSCVAVEVVQCDLLPPVINGQVAFSGPPVEGAVVTYTCVPGFIVDGDETRTCQADATWSNAEPVCVPVDCGDLADPSNGSVSAPNTLLQARAIYSCDEGYLLEGREARICEENGQWSGEPSICLPVLCPRLDNPPHGELSIDEPTFGNTATYTCRPGFMLDGEPTRTCQADATWSGDTPTCDPVDCGALDAPDNGNVEALVTLFGHRALYQCDIGYRPSLPNTVRTCEANGTWSGAEPTCELVSCPPLMPVANGSIDATENTFESDATYTCNEGYRLRGLDTRTCRADGSWSGQEPVCEIVRCAPLSQPMGGNVRIQPMGRAFDATATYTCNPGLDMVGESTRTCQADGNWSGDAPACGPGSCGEPDAPENGSASYGNIFYGDTVTYSCDEGYDLEGDDTRNCGDEGVWEGAAPTCAIVDCGALTDTTNGAVSLTDTTYNNSATYTCDDGYELSSEDARTCQADGTWSGDEPTCDPVDCGDPSAPTNGLVSFTDTTYDNSAAYTCDDGYELEGDTSITCEADATWSGSIPTCNPVDCGALDDITYGSASYDPDTTYTSSATYTCDSGFALSSEDDRTCQADGTWSGDEPTCGLDDCELALDTVSMDDFTVVTTDTYWQYEGTFTENPSDFFEPDCTSGGDDALEVYLSFTAPAAGYYRLHTNDDPSSGTAATDTQIQVRASCDPDDTALACDDDSGDSYRADLVVELAQDQEVFIVVEPWSTETNENFLLSIVLLPEEENADCSDAEVCINPFACIDDVCTTIPDTPTITDVYADSTINYTGIIEGYLFDTSGCQYDNENGDAVFIRVEGTLADGTNADDIESIYIANSYFTELIGGSRVGSSFYVSPTADGDTGFTLVYAPCFYDSLVEGSIPFGEEWLIEIGDIYGDATYPNATSDSFGWTPADPRE